MSERYSNFMEFKVLGSNFLDCGFVLTGRMYTGGSEICSRIEQELRNGTLGIEVKEGTISFIFEGVIIGFTENPEKLSMVKQMLKPETHLCFEPWMDSNYKGFALMVRH